MRIEKTLNQPPAEHITNFTWGRPLMVGPVIDEKVWKFLMALFKKCRHIRDGIASTTANVLLSRSKDLSLKTIKTTPMWGRSILQRLGLWRRVAATRKMKVSEGARTEAGLQHHSLIVKITENITFQSPFYLIVTRHYQSMLLLVVLQRHVKIQLVLVWLEVPTSAALHWLWQSNSMEKYYYSR